MKENLFSQIVESSEYILKVIMTTFVGFINSHSRTSLTTKNTLAWSFFTYFIWDYKLIKYLSCIYSVQTF